MNPQDIYSFRSYREYLRAQFPAAGEKRGQRAKLARFIGCQTSFISLVLSAKAHLSEDMAFAAGDFLKLSAEEVQFFLLLFHHERAGSQKLRFHYHQQMNLLLQKRAEVHSRVKSDLEVEHTQQMRFFSEWIYIAIFTAVQIPGCQEVRVLADKLHLSEEVVSRATSWLAEHGYLKHDGGKFSPLSKRIHLGNDSYFIDQHHRNWRNEAIRSLNRKSESDLHYSGALSLSSSDYFRIREILLQAIANIETILTPSADEELVGINFDLFKY